MEDCLFCKMVTGEIPVSEVVRNEHALAFRDISPQAPSHVLVVPTRHVRDASQLADTDGDLLASLFATANEVAKSEGLNGGYRLVMNVGDDAGNSVPHLHLHVLGGRSLDWPPG